jgi:hypothetical protein
MTVRCEGDARVMELVGEKQDFEAELSRFGFRHEDFTLCVRRADPARGNTSGTSNYAVQVTSASTRKCNVYWGGPRETWVAEFVVDLANGMYGEPTEPRPLRSQQLNAA